MAKIQEWRGIRGLRAAEVLKDDSVEGYEAGLPFDIAGVAELSRTTETSSEAHYYDNAPAVVIDSTGADEVTISVSAIPFEVLAKITGQVYDASNGVFYEGERESKYFALGYITEKTDGTEVFVWRYKGTFNIPDSTHATKDDGSEANGQELVFTGINTTAKFDIPNGESTAKKTVKALNLDTSINQVNETNFFEEVITPDKMQSISVMSL